MRTLLCAVALCWAIALPLLAQQSAPTPTPINPQDVTIHRDRWGVPHIHGKTDADAAYGLAWANSEDDFATMQQLLAAAKGRASRILGKQGLAFDYFYHWMRTRERVAAAYETQLSPQFRRILEAYAQALNTYAEQHPEEVLTKGIFPLTALDIAVSYNLGMALIGSVPGTVGRIRRGAIDDYKWGIGSNAFALKAPATADGATHLVINAHQPLEGPLSWYEAHVVSNEGWNMYGGTFPAGVTIFHGISPNLGWAHTTNYPDHIDVYKLKMEGGLRYRYDGKLLKLEKRKAPLTLMVGKLPLKVSKACYWSEHGPVYKNKDGFYAVRFPTLGTIRGPEQWYRMNKAQNLKEFQEALRLQGIPRFNCVYADKQDNVYYVSQGLVPRRTPGWDYRGLLPGDTSAVVWNYDFLTIDELPNHLNPDCGYVYNVNQPEFNTTCPAEDLNPADFDPKLVGFYRENNLRGRRFIEWMAQRKSAPLTLDDLKAIKWDKRLPDSSQWNTSIYGLINGLNTEKYPDLKAAVELLRGWDKQFTTENRAAALFFATGHFLYEKTKFGVLEFHTGFRGQVTEEVFAAALRRAQKHLLKHFGRIDPQYGEVLVLARGGKTWPLWGFTDVHAAMTGKPFGKRGQFRGFVGEGLVVFGKWQNGKLQSAEAIHQYGSSNKPNSPHYADQVEMYLKHQTRPVTLDMDEIRRTAVRSYHPGQPATTAQGSSTAPVAPVR